MTAGDFVDVYGAAEETGAWDAVATVFFLDTGRNPIAYIEVLSLSR